MHRIETDPLSSTSCIDNFFFFNFFCFCCSLILFYHHISETVSRFRLVVFFCLFVFAFHFIKIFSINKIAFVDDFRMMSTMILLYYFFYFFFFCSLTQKYFREKNWCAKWWINVVFVCFALNLVGFTFFFICLFVGSVRFVIANWFRWRFHLLKLTNKKIWDKRKTTKWI